LVNKKHARSHSDSYAREGICPLAAPSKATGNADFSSAQLGLNETKHHNPKTQKPETQKIKKSCKFW
jgi:hypothetical protein